MELCRTTHMAGGIDRISGTGGAIPPYAFKRLTLVNNENRIKEEIMMIYDEISNYVRNNDAIPEGIHENETRIH